MRLEAAFGVRARRVLEAAVSVRWAPLREVDARRLARARRRAERRSGRGRRWRGDPRLIYALVDPWDGAVRYVGQTLDPAGRLRGHVRASRGAKAAWVADLAGRLGGAPEMVELEWCPAPDADGRELAWMRRFADEGADLLNVVGMGA